LPTGTENVCYRVDRKKSEVDEAVTRIGEEADQDANIIVDATFDDSLEGIVRVSGANLDPSSIPRQFRLLDSEGSY